MRSASACKSSGVLSKSSGGPVKPKSAPVTSAKGPSAKTIGFGKAFAKAAADVAAERKPAEIKGKSKDKKAKDAQYRNLIDPRRQEQKKKVYLEAFERIKDMSMGDLQVELIVCIRAEHYRDALMYSQIILEKDPENALVAQFQPLLASLSVQANEPLDGSSSDDEEGSGSEETGEEEPGAENIGQGMGNLAIDEDDSDSDDPETAWMWSDTWRTDKD